MAEVEAIVSPTSVFGVETLHVREGRVKNRVTGVIRARLIFRRAGDYPFANAWCRLLAFGLRKWIRGRLFSETG